VKKIEQGTKSEIQSWDDCSGLTILVVDDEPNIGEYMRALLGAYGHKVLYLDSVDEAIEHMRYMKFDLAFIGAVMPGGDGCDVGALVKTLSPKTRVFLFTEPVAEEWAAALLRDGFNVEALACPFELPHLLRVIDDIQSRRARIGKNHSSSY